MLQREIEEAFEPAGLVEVETARSNLKVICGHFDLAARDGRGQVTGAIEARSLGPFDAAVVATDVQAVWRDAPMIRRDPARNLFLIYQQAGQSLIRQGETESVMRPGQFHLVDSAYPSEFRYFGDLSRKVSVHLPRDETVRRLGAGCLGGLAIDPTDPLSVALEAVLLKLVVAPAPAASHLGDTLVDLLGAYLRCREAQTSSVAVEETARLGHARDLIARNARDPDYGIDRLCAELVMSRRSVQRLFSTVGETFSTALQEARLDLARRDLLRMPDRAVADIGFASGFSDLSHFHRCFRARFGSTPGAMRKRQLSSD